MSKIEPEMDNPIDVLIIESISRYSDDLVKLGVTPNMITTLSFITELLSIYFILENKYTLAAVMFFLSYYFDDMDGYIARKYNMVTKFGDYYDHITDIATVPVFAFLVFYKLNALEKNKTRVMILLLILLILTSATFMHMGCTAIQFNDTVSVLTTLVNSCPNIKSMRYLRYFSSGTLFTYLSLVCYSLNFYKF